MENNCILPGDLVEEILSRLPIKDLLRLRCVSKGWCALIDDAGFIRKHYQAQYSISRLDDNMNYFVDIDIFSSREEFHLLSIKQGDVLTVPLNGDVRRDSEAVLPYGANLYEFQCFGCVNGIICLACISTDIPYLTSKNFLALWNPATRDFKTLAYPEVCTDFFRVIGFGFDVSSNDFKILVVCGIKEVEQLCSSYYGIYSLKTNSWKQIENPWPKAPGSPVIVQDGYLNGVYYWMTYLLPEEWFSPKQYVIVSFNFTTEVFNVSDLPKDAISFVLQSYQVEIALYKERLALVISQKVQEEPLYVIHIWAATQFDDFGAPLSWEPVFTMEPTPAISGLDVVKILMNGDLQLAFHFPCTHHGGECENCYDSEVYQYSQSTGEFKKFEIWWKAWYRYVESLYPLSKRLGQA